MTKAGKSAKTHVLMVNGVAFGLPLGTSPLMLGLK
jgi:hypothetical protein